MIVIVSWYADGSGQPQVDFLMLSYREGSGFYGVSAIVESVRNTKHKECRAWEVRSGGYSLLYDSTAKKEEKQ
jgi:hypothetical protein